MKQRKAVNWLLILLAVTIFTFSLSAKSGDKQGELTSVLASSVIYETNFDDLELGDIFTKDTVWTVGYGSSPGDGTANVVANGYDGSAKCVKITASSLFAPHLNFSGTEDHASTNNFKISFMLKVESLASGNGIYFNSNTDGLGEIALQSEAGGCKVVAKNANFTTTNICPLGVWFPISYVINTAVDNEKLLEFQFGDYVYKDLDAPITTSSTKRDRFRYFRFFLWGGNTSVLMDDFKIEYVPRETTDNKISVAGTEIFHIFDTNGTLRVFNEGSIPVEIEVQSPFDFLTLAGKKNLTTNLVASGSLDLPIELNRSSMGSEYFEGVISVSSPSMTTSLQVKIQSGNDDAGYTFYKSNFNALEEGKDIREQDSSWTTGYGTPPTCPITTIAGAKCLALNYDALNALHLAIESPAGLSENFNYRVSFSGYFPAEFEGEYSDFWIGFRVDNLSCIEQSLRGHAEENNVTFVNMGNTAALGEFFDLSYTINTNPENPKLLETTFAGVTSNLNLSVSGSTEKDYLTQWRLFGWCNSESAPLYLKDIVIEAVPRSSTAPQLDVAKIGQVFYKDREEDTYLTVFNSGKGTLNFKAEVTRGNDWLAIEGADPETGILVDAIEDTGSKKYVLNIDREILGNNYGFAQITVTAGSDTKVVDVYVQSYDENGITFYYNDFEETALGLITKVDPAWLQDRAEVVEEDGNRCMRLQGNGNLHALVNVPDNLYDQYNFRVSCRVKVPGTGVPRLTFGANKRQGEYDLRCENNKVNFTISDSDNPSIVTNEVSAGQWFDLSYTFNSDPLNRRTVSVIFGSSSYDLNDPNTNPDCVYSYFEEFRFYIWDEGEPYFIDNFCVEAVKKPVSAPVAKVSVPEAPISYSTNEFSVLVLNLGGNSFNFSAAPGEGSSYLTVPEDTIEVFGSYLLKVGIDRSKIGYGFYRPKIVFTTDIAGQETIELEVPIQGGTKEDGYVIYSSNFSELSTTKESGAELIGELSDQDICWQRSSSHNRADIVVDPIRGHKVAKFINCNEWVNFTGYLLKLGIPAAAAKDYDVVYSMDINIPKSYVDREGDEHPTAAFFVSQVNGNRQCEAEFYLDETQASLPVYINLRDITNQNWWDEQKDEAIPVESEEWFSFYMRFSTELIDYDYKQLFAVNFGLNSYLMEGEDSTLTYPSGISEEQLNREDLTKLKLWSYCDNADICLDNVNILLVPKGVPEPALLFAGALLLVFLYRRR